MDGSLSFQLVDGDGVYNGNGLENFARSIKLAECGVSYAVVSAMGPRSSGKSTLLNHLFGTSFREMNASEGRFQTTKGIWMAKCVGIEPCTIVMDLQGTDGRERGEDDTNFERQSALFALAVSDIVLINMWCHDIGREHAANKPLLKTVFQVMMRLFSSRRTTLLFVIRDKTKTPPKILEHILREDIQKIWDAVPKPQAHKETPLSDFFIVEVVALSSYAYEEEEFKEQVASLRERFLNSIAPGGLAGDRRGVVLASKFCYSSQDIWSVIKEDKDLHLPTLKVMLATFRCKEIANEKFASLRANESWRKLEKDVEANYVPSFGKKLSDILDSCLSRYDLEVTYFDDTIKTAERQQLESKILQLVHSAYLSVLGHLQFKMLDDFKVALDVALNSGKEFVVASRDCSQHSISVFDERCADAAVAQAQWDPSEIRDKLKRDIDAHITAVHFENFEAQKEKLKKDLEKFPVERTAPYGHSQTGRTFDIMDLHSIKIIEIGCGSWIDSLRFQYTSDGNLHWTPKVGGDGGGGVRIELNDGEYITQVKGEYALKGEKGGIITNLKFSTSHNRKFGPYGIDYFWKRNMTFVPFKVKGRIVGFHGTAGMYLSSIGFYRIG